MLLLLLTPSPEVDEEEEARERGCICCCCLSLSRSDLHDSPSVEPSDDLLDGGPSMVYRLAYAPLYKCARIAEADLVRVALRLQ